MEAVDRIALRQALDRLEPHGSEHAAVVALIHQHDRWLSQLQAMHAVINQACDSIAKANEQMKRRRQAGG